MPVLSPVFIDAVSTGRMPDVSLIVVVDVSEVVSLLFPELQAVRLNTMTTVAKTLFIVFIFYGPNSLPCMNAYAGLSKIMPITVMVILSSLHDTAIIFTRRYWKHKLF